MLVRADSRRRIGAKTISKQNGVEIIRNTASFASCADSVGMGIRARFHGVDFLLQRLAELFSSCRPCRTHVTSTIFSEKAVTYANSLYNALHAISFSLIIRLPILFIVFHHNQRHTERWQRHALLGSYVFGFKQ